MSADSSFEDEVVRPVEYEPPKPIMQNEVWEQRFIVENILMPFLRAEVKCGAKIPMRGLERSAEMLDTKHLDVFYFFDHIITLCIISKKSLLRQPMVLRIKQDDLPITVIGDIHGQAVHLRRILHTNGWPGEGNRYLFLGDYVDRGFQSVECFCLLMALQFRYPSRFHLLRGNHEDGSISFNYGLFGECQEKYGAKQGQFVWHSMLEVFNCLPAAAFLGGKILCLHGGISPFYNKIDELDHIERPCVIPPYGALCDTTWSDPCSDITGWQMSKRRVSFQFGQNILEEFCDANGVDIIIRGHQILREMYPAGLTWFLGGRLVTIFSSVNYENRGNNASIVKVDSKMRLHFVSYACRKWRDAGSPASEDS